MKFDFWLAESLLSEKQSLWFFDSASPVLCFSFLQITGKYRKIYRWQKS
jgi:hypothetical protein